MATASIFSSNYLRVYFSRLPYSATYRKAIMRNVVQLNQIDMSQSHHIEFMLMVSVISDFAGIVHNL